MSVHVPDNSAAYRDHDRRCWRRHLDCCIERCEELLKLLEWTHTQRGNCGECRSMSICPQCKIMHEAIAKELDNR